ncbi:MAG: diguanylate cyclase [Arcobacter sp.]|nr:MAG: diguanylate cyclase [Arcobacter sp.]
MYNKYKILSICFLLFCTTFLSSNEKVVLQLKWLHQFQFAGYYAAKEKGFYNDLGLDVEIKQRNLATNNIQEVIDGKAQYGIADSVLLLYKAKNEPVVIISPIFQHSPSVLLFTKSSGINSVYDLTGKNIIFYKNDTDGFSLLSMLKKFDVRPNLIRKRSKDDYLKLVNNEVDSMAAYLTNEPFYLKEKNIETTVIDPMNYGFDLYGDMLFTNKDEAVNHPKRVEKFKKATLKGWEYALNNKEEIIKLINEKYTKKSIEHLRYEANAIDKMINKDIMPIGSMDKGRLQYIYSLYKDYGLSSGNLDVKDFIFEEYKSNKGLIKLSKEEKAYLEKHPVLTIPSLNTFPPFNFYENNQIKGYSIDFMKLVGQYMDVEIKALKNKSWKEYLSMLKNGTLDIMPHLALSEERKKFAEFTNFVHIKYTIGLVIRKDDDIKSMKDLENKTLAVTEKTFIHTYIKKNFPKQKLLLASSTENALEAVSRGSADAVVGSIPTFSYYIQNSWLSNLKTMPINDLGLSDYTELFMAVSKGNTLLKSILEKVISSIPPSEIAYLKEKWMNVKPSSKEIFTKEQKSYLKDKKSINICVNPNRMPYEEIKNGKHNGITSEYIRHFSQYLHIPIKLISTKNWLQTIEYAKQRKCDLITIMIETEEQKKYFNFSTKYIKSPLILSTKINEPFINNITDVLDRKIGIVKGYAYKENLKKKYPSINIIDVADIEDGLKKVSEGKLFGYIDTLPAVGLTIQKKYIGELKITGTINNDSIFSIATRNDEPLLNDIFNILIKNIPVEESDRILNKWISVKYQEEIDYKKILSLSIIFLLILLIVMYKNNAIKKINKKMKKYIALVDENIISSSTDIHGNITAVSKAFCEISGYEKYELLGKNHNIIRHPDISKEVFKELWNDISSGKTWKGELKNKKKNGDYYWVDVTISPIYDERKKIIGYTSLRQDITNKKVIEEISIKDALTNIFNRRHFNDTFPKYVSGAKRKNDMVSFIIMDVDFFKQFNDNYGHQKGDEALIAIASTLNEILHRVDDYCFRLGGEEFGVLFKVKDRKHALAFAEIIRKNIENLSMEHKYSEVSKYITVSMGLYCNYANEFEEMDKVYKATDDLLYEAKRTGRNKIIMNDI